MEETDSAPADLEQCVEDPESDAESEYTYSGSLPIFTVTCSLNNRLNSVLKACLGESDPSPGLSVSVKTE